MAAWSSDAGCRRRNRSPRCWTGQQPGLVIRRLLLAQAQVPLADASGRITEAPEQRRERQPAVFDQERGMAVEHAALEPGRARRSGR